MPRWLKFRQPLLLGLASLLVGAVQDDVRFCWFGLGVMAGGLVAYLVVITELKDD